MTSTPKYESDKLLFYQKSSSSTSSAQQINNSVLGLVECQFRPKNSLLQGSLHSKFKTLYNHVTLITHRYDSTVDSVFANIYYAAVRPSEYQLIVLSVHLYCNTILRNVVNNSKVDNFPGYEENNVHKSSHIRRFYMSPASVSHH